MKTLAIICTAVATLGAGAASAQSIDQRHINQERRIEQGERSGQLTRGEAMRLERQQGRIDRTEARERAAQGGYLTANQRANLQARENRASADIYKLKHNGRVR